MAYRDARADVESASRPDQTRRWSGSARGLRDGYRGAAGRAAIEALHWLRRGGGAHFALLPTGCAGGPEAGPGYGLALWLGFEVAMTAAGTAPHERAPCERASLAADHVLTHRPSRFAPPPTTVAGSPAAAPPRARRGGRAGVGLSPARLPPAREPASGCAQRRARRRHRSGGRGRRARRGSAPVGAEARRWPPSSASPARRPATGEDGFGSWPAEAPGAGGDRGRRRATCEA